MAACLGLMGCSPPGPRLLLQGKELVEKGRYQEAVPRLEKATTLLPKNPLAWNYLGLAYHANHQMEEAVKAYRIALSLDHKLAAVRYNLGCLYLDQGSNSIAFDELRSYTLLQPNAVDGWIKQGTVLLRLRRLDEAEKSFRAALELQVLHPEAINGLGLVQVQRRRLQDALNHFNAAALQSPPYGPALLNSAIVNQQLNNLPLALQRYRQYLAQQPRPADADVVTAAVQQLEFTLNPTPVASKPVSRPVAPVVVAEAVKSNAVVAQIPAPRSSVTPSQSASSTPERSSPVQVASVKPDAPPVPKAAVPPVATSKPASEVPKQPPKKPGPTKGAEALVAKPVTSVKVPERVESAELEVTQLRTNVAVRPAQELARLPSTAPKSVAAPDPASVNSDGVTNGARRGFFSRLNPFSGRNRSDASGGRGATSSSGQGSRYSYLSPDAPTAGNAMESDKAFKRGLKAQKSGSRSLAITEYQAALKADPANYDAYFNLGLAALEGGDTRLSLWAYEIALALNPNAADAHYNFALSLKAGGYWQDAVEQLNDLAEEHGSDARVHLSLANLYAQQLQQTAMARVHYQRVLEIDPRHPEAGKIRYWLAGNP